MDGFYVAKIQKLSDKRKGDHDKNQVAEEGVANEEEVAVTADVKKGAAVVEDDSQKSKCTTALIPLPPPLFLS